jgi:hypothetical protein
VLGAAVMFFELPSSELLARAFIGARAWNERRLAPAPAAAAPLHRAPKTNIDKPGQTFDGFTLYACASMTTASDQVFLINMRYELVHRWRIAFSQVWPNPPHVPDGVKDALVGIYGCHLYPNGDLLVVFLSLEDSARGYGLARLDKDSNVLWKYAANVHHDVDVGEDGTIYAIAQDWLDSRPRGLESVPPPWLVDYLVMLSPEGKELRKPIPILDSLWKSPYAPLLSGLEKPREQLAPEASTAQRFDALTRKQDVLHTNSVKVLRRELAPRFPGLKAGQVLISVRSLDAIAVLDPATEEVVWAARGPWRAQHDAQFLANGRLLIFDNLGSPGGSRVLEYDPRTQAFPWSHPGATGAPFFTSVRGMSQRLPNGNTLIVNSEGWEIREVSPRNEVVWSCGTHGFVSTGRRYAAAELDFVKGSHRPRP